MHRPPLHGSNLHRPFAPVWAALFALLLLAGCGAPPETPAPEPAAPAAPAPVKTPAKPAAAKKTTPGLTVAPTGPGTPAIKVHCIKRGIQVITGAALLGLGAKLDEIDPAAMALVHFDKSIPLYFTGKGPRFLPEDAIYFFSDGATQDDHYYINIEADYAPQAQLFMLHLAPSAHQPVRYADSEIKSPAATSPLDYPVLQTGGSRHFEENKVWQFFDAPLWRKSPTDFRSWKNLTFPASTRSTPELDAAAHRLKVEVNGKFTFEHTWKGWEPQRMDLQIPADVLQAGDNQLHLELLKPEPKPGEDENKFVVDIVNVDWFQVEFEQPTHVFEDVNEFIFPAPGDGLSTGSAQRFAIRNFTTPDLLILDRATTSRLVAQAFPEAEGSPLFAANLERPNQAGSVVATTMKAALAPYKLELVSIVDHFAAPPAGDMLVLTHPNFIPTLERFVEWKRARGLKVAVVDVKDIFNQRTGGYPKPEALRDFVQATVRSGQGAKYLLLVGDSASIAVYQSYVPAYAYLQSGTHANDNYFVAYDTPEGKPELAVGRISARTPEQVNNYIDKIIAYESRAHPGDWMGRGLFIGASYSWAQKDCLDLIESYIRPDLLGAYVKTEIFNEDPDYHAKLTEQLLRELNRGSLTVNFFGHGGGSVWEVGPTSQVGNFTRHLFDQSQVGKMDNKFAPPLIMALTCYTNDFDDPHVAQTLGEAFVNSKGGAIAVVGSAARASISVNKRYTTLFWDQATQGVTGRRLGDMFVEAKRVMNSPSANVQFILLGDPSLDFTLPWRDIEVSPPRADAAGKLTFAYKIPQAVTLPTTMTCTLLDYKEAELAHFTLTLTKHEGSIVLESHLDPQLVAALPEYFRAVVCTIPQQGMIHIGGNASRPAPKPSPTPVSGGTPPPPPLGTPLDSENSDSQSADQESRDQ